MRPCIHISSFLDYIYYELNLVQGVFPSTHVVPLSIKPLTPYVYRMNAKSAKEGIQNIWLTMSYYYINENLSMGWV
jgi:hypothetical protein